MNTLFKAVILASALGFVGAQTASATDDLDRLFGIEHKPAKHAKHRAKHAYKAPEKPTKKAKHVKHKTASKKPAKKTS